MIRFTLISHKPAGDGDQYPMEEWRSPYADPLFSSDTGGELSAVLSMLWRRRWSIVGGVMIAVAAAAGIVMLLPQTYFASAVLLVERRGSAEAQPLQVLQRVGQVSSMETEAFLMRSRRVVEPVVRDLDLQVQARVGGRIVRPRQVFDSVHVDPAAGTGEFTVVRAGPDGYQVLAGERSGRRVVASGRRGEVVTFGGVTLGLPLAGEPFRTLELEVRPLEAAIAETQERITTGPAAQNTVMLRLTCGAQSGEEAYEVCRAVLEHYMRLRASLQRSEARTAAEFLSEQARHVGNSLAAAEDSVNDYLSATQAIGLEARASSEVQRHIELQAQRDELSSELEALRSARLQIDRRPPAERSYRQLALLPIFNRDQNQVLAGLFTQLAALEAERVDVGFRRAEGSDVIAAIDSQIEEVERRFRDLSIAQEERVADRLQWLGAALAGSSARLSEIPTQKVELTRLERKVNLLEDLFGFLQSRLREAEVAQAVALPTVRLVDEPVVPLAPGAPSRTKGLGLGALLGLALGLSLAVVRELNDRRIRDSQAVELGTGVDILATVPQLNDRERRALGKATLKGTALTVAPKSALGAFVAAESFRALHYELAIQDRSSGTSGRVVVVTSTGRGEGKTFVSCNLAGARAQVGRTLLVDSDYRAGSVSEVLGLDRSAPGLTDVLAGTAELAGCVQGAHVGNGIELDVLPSGTLTGSSGLTLDWTRCGDLIAERFTTHDYDYVVIDTPPLVLFPDAAVLATHADSILFVVRPGFTDRQALGRTLERLRRAGATNVGLVWNGADREMGRYKRMYAYS